jgi:dolichyl-phosphate beta-glucosyltransferase
MIDGGRINTTIVSPIFNESIRFNWQHWTNILDNNSTVNFLFVDDASTDNLDYIYSLEEKYKNVFYLRLTKNLGKANAIREGLLYALNNTQLNTNTLGYLDFDDSILASEVQRIIFLFGDKLEKLYSFDTLWASRVKLNGRNISRSNSRHFYSRILITLIGFNYPLLPYDSQCGFKLFLNNDIFQESIQSPFLTKWFIDLELLIRLTQISGKRINIWEEPLLSWKETRSFNYSFVNSFRTLREVIFICKEIRKIIKY